MSDLVAVSVIAAVPATLAALFSFVSTLIVSRAAKTVKLLETNTNSIKDALVKVTGDEALARGRLAGRAEQKAEDQL
jgi:hypothetical protein